MKILIYSPRFYPQIGGLENLTLLLAKSFQQLGHTVNVISFSQPDGSECGVNVYYSPSHLQQARLFLQCSILYMPNLSLKGVWLLLLQPFKKWVVSHNVWYNGYNLQTRITAYIKLILLNFCHNISVSKAIAISLPVASTIIYNAYDTSVFKTYTHLKRKKKLLFVGRLVSDKGLDTLLEAFLILKNVNPSITLTITGEGEEKLNVENFIQQYQLKDSIVLTGSITGNQLAEIMNLHEILVVPSKWAEPFGIVALEGLACGCRVVCSASGGLPEAVGKFGFLFRNGNTVELYKAIQQAISASKFNETEVAEYLTQFNPEITAKNYLNAFN